ncbi:hypothetical protein LNQ49_13175 [Flavobacterium sp. F-65]|uniref:6-bladed beta-propeller protein n=1 Tax=Flavobacterium pisciphilum TaxID=2893755 RepID=A0ABS8MWJ6_9FLAO|nr:hypothetical protein [Flavobacterium sp. F-65]MCC9072536.1 hypothetical protein [Flavobacterium sp. F-65]
MKKLFLFFLIFHKSILIGQTVLNSYPLDFKKYDESNMILNVENTATHDVFVFATNTENLTILKYNSALFLKSDITVPRTNLENHSIIGYSFSEDGNPTLYWATEDYKSILVVKYYLEGKTYKMLSYNSPISSQFVITTFQKNNLFYIVTRDLVEPELIVYVFKNGIVEEKLFDFSAYTFLDKKTQRLSFNQVITENPIEKIELDEYNPLFKSSKKSKIYMLNEHIILTLDHNPTKTQVFDINLETNDLTEKNFTQSVINNPKKLGNSFLYNDKIYQINATQDELLFDIKDYNSGETLKSFKVMKNDTIRFKSSPLLIQGENQRTKELKNTSKFLQRLSYLDIAISVFKNSQNTLVTLGGVPKIEKRYYTVNDQLYTWDFGLSSSETVFFESTLNQNNEFTKFEQQPFALDNINYFLEQNRKVTLPNILKFKDFHILGYYDTTTKQYVMRKFTDGFTPEESLNPIINKAVFSKPFPVEKP